MREAVGERAAAIIRALPDDPWKLGEALPQVRDAAFDLGHSTPPNWQNRDKPED